MSSAATRLDRHVAARDLDELPHEWDTRYELIGGVLHRSRRPSHDHQQILARLVIRVGAAVLERGGDVVQEAGVILRLTRGPTEWLEQPLGPDEVLNTPLIAGWSGLLVADVFPPG